MALSCPPRRCRAISDLPATWSLRDQPQNHVRRQAAANTDLIHLYAGQRGCGGVATESTPRFRAGPSIFYDPQHSYDSFRSQPRYCRGQCLPGIPLRVAQYPDWWGHLLRLRPPGIRFLTDIGLTVNPFRGYPQLFVAHRIYSQ